MLEYIVGAVIGFGIGWMLKHRCTVSLVKAYRRRAIDAEHQRDEVLEQAIAFSESVSGVSMRVMLLKGR